MFGGDDHKIEKEPNSECEEISLLKEMAEL
jgi:hypothetical protein